MANVDLNTEQWIDQYLRKELSPDEVQRFEARMQTDADFLEEVMLRKDIIVGIRAAEHQLLRERLDRIRQSVDQNKPMPQDLGRKKGNKLYLILAIAGAAVAALVVYLLVK